MHANVVPKRRIKYQHRHPIHQPVASEPIVWLYQRRNDCIRLIKSKMTLLQRVVERDGNARINSTVNRMHIRTENNETVVLIRRKSTVPIHYRHPSYNVLNNSSMTFFILHEALLT